MEQKYTAAGVEPSLEELLNDRIAQLLMLRDGIAPADVWRAVAAARLRLASGIRHAAEQQSEPDLSHEPVSPSGADRNTRSPAG